jgi:hypothetical protein
MEHKIRASLRAFAELSFQECPQVVEDVYQRVVDHDYRDMIVLRFATKALSVIADSDDDTIWAEFGEAEQVDTTGFEVVSQEHPWSNVVGKPLEFGWVTIDRRRCCDGIALGPSLFPTLLLNVVGSRICVYTVNEIAWRPRTQKQG